MRKPSVPVIFAALLGIAALVFFALNTASLPKPQSEFVDGEPAPDFTLKDQSGNSFHLADLRGTRVLLVFYRGYWCPFCMRQLREFARHKSGFDQLHVRVVGLSVDNPQQAYRVFDKMTSGQFTMLIDPGAVVIRQYGLLHAGGRSEGDIAIPATLLIDEQGRERWRHVSTSVGDISTADDTLQHIRDAQ